MSGTSPYSRPSPVSRVAHRLGRALAALWSIYKYKLRHWPPCRGKARHATCSRKLKYFCVPKHIPEWLMRRITDDNIDTSRPSPLSAFSESDLITPREIRFVVSHKAIIIMRQRVCRVTIYDVSATRPVEYYAEVTRYQFSSPKRPRSIRQKRASPQQLRRSLATAERHIKFPASIDAVQTRKSCSVEI